MIPSSIRYTILPGRVQTKHLIPQHNSAFNFWKNFWSDIYGKQDALEHFLPSEFARQDAVSIISWDSAVIACHAHTLFHLDSAADSHLHYFKFYDPELLSEFRKNAQTVLSFEFLATDPKWRRQKLGVSLAEVLIGLGCKIFEESRADLGLATARKDVGIPTIAGRWGFYSIRDNIMRRNFPCEVIGITPASRKHHNDTLINLWVDRLWQSRNDQRHGTPTPDMTPTFPALKKAA